MNSRPNASPLHFVELVLMMIGKCLFWCDGCRLGYRLRIFGTIE
ncbi:MAG: hypothetical protein ACRC62_06605 [Microcoleus sp.]